MEKINIAELLKDCPQGMELDCVIFDNVTLDRVSDYGNYPIRIKTPEGKIELNKYGQFFNNDFSKCLIFPKGKTTWEGFQRPFKDGDVIACTNLCCTFISIFKERAGENRFVRYCAFILDDNELKADTAWSDFSNPRFATEEEKQKLFQAIKDNGYKWNEETKTLEKLIEPKFKVGDRIKHKRNDSLGTVALIDESYYHCAFSVIPIYEQDNWELVSNKFDINTLKPFESKVLVRHNRDNKWCGSFFSHIDEDFHSHCYKFVTIAGKSYPMCIPYEGNEHLLGTKDDCEEYYKIWEERA